jgi:hypothetical protein
MFNSQDVMDYTNIKNKPTIPTDIDDLTDTGNLLGGTTYTAGTGLQLNTGTFSLNANIGDLQNVSATAPTSGVVRIMGYQLGDDDQIWFDPDKTWVELS